MIPRRRADRPGRIAVAAGIGGAWGAQILSMSLQLVYTAYASRRIAQTSFGAYAVALSVVAIGAMVANVGLTNATARRADADEATLRALVLAGLISSGTTAALLAGTASVWARVWGDASAAPVVIALSPTLILATWSGILGGHARRMQKYRLFNGATLSAAVVGTFAGLAAVSVWDSALALCVMPLTTAVVSTVILLAATGKAGLPGSGLRSVVAELAFGARSTAAWSVALLSNTLPIIALGRYGGVDVLGQWNRAQAVARTPIDALGRPSVTIVYPLFREPRGGDTRTITAWTAVLAVAFCAILPPMLWAAPMVPAVTAAILGPGWQTASEMAPYVWLATGMAMISLLAGSALESAAAFRIVIGAQVACAAVIGLAFFIMASTGEWRVMATSVIIGSAVAHAVQVVGAARLGYISLAGVLRWYLIAVTAGLVGSLAVAAAGGQSLALGLALAISLVAAYAAIVLRNRRRIPPLRRLLQTGQGRAV